MDVSPSRAPSGRRVVAEIVVVSAILGGLVSAYYASRWSSVQDFVRSIDHGLDLFADFVLRFYPVGRDFFDSGRVYPGFYYSAFFLLLIAPLGALPQTAAVAVWGVVQGLATLALLLIPAPTLLRQSKWLLYVYLLLFLTSVPVLHNLKWGQVSVPLVAGVLGTLLLYRDDRRTLAAVVLAATVAVKFYTGVFLVYFAFKRDFVFLRAFVVATIVLAVILPALVLGPGGTLDFYAQIGSNLTTDRGRITTGASSQYFPVVVERWLQWSARAETAPIATESSALRSILQVTGWVVAAFQSFLVLRLVRHRPSGETAWSFALLAVALPFVVPTSWPHYFSHLPFFQVWALGEVLRDRRGSATTALLLIPLAGSMVLSSMLAFELAGEWRIYAYLGSLCLSNLLLLGVLDWLALSRRRTA